MNDIAIDPGILDKLHHRAESEHCSVNELLEAWLAQPVSEVRFDLLLENSSYIFAVFDRDLRHLYVNPIIETISGIPAKNFLGKTHRELGMPEESILLWGKHLRAVFETAQEGTMDFDFPSPQGITYFHAHLIPHLDAQGAVHQVMSVVYDVTERKQAEQALRESEQRYRTLADFSPIATIVSSYDKKMLYCNPATAHLLGAQSSNEIINRDSRDFILPELHDVQAQRVDSLAGGRSAEPFVYRYRRLNGEIVEAETRSTPITYQGQPAILVMAQDVTERKRAEQAQREWQKLEIALEKERELSTIKNNVMRTISHEFRTPLAIIATSSDLLLRYHDRMSLEQRQTRLETIQHQVKNLNQMIEEIASVVHEMFSNFVFQPRPINLELLCQLVIREFQSTVGAKHHLHFDSDGQLQNISIDERLVNRILMNLLSNAIKYSPENSNICVNTFKDDNTVILEVKDEGIGISLQDQQRLFEPFFRASNVGTIGGTGLGLSIVRDCARLHQGSISVKSELNRGTTFTVSLSAQN